MAALEWDELIPERAAFSTDVLLIAPAVMGIIFSASRIWDAISDPLVGYLSDRTRTRFGDGQGAVYGLAIGDVNGDGVPDIVAGRSNAPKRPRSFSRARAATCAT